MKKLLLSAIVTLFTNVVFASKPLPANPLPSPSEMTQLVNDLINYDEDTAGSSCVNIAIPNLPNKGKSTGIEIFPWQLMTLANQTGSSCQDLARDRGLLNRIHAFMVSGPQQYYAFVIWGFDAGTTTTPPKPVTVTRLAYTDNLGPHIEMDSDEQPGWYYNTSDDTAVFVTQ